MPYIPPESRLRAEVAPYTPGELNFALTSLLIGYLEKNGRSYVQMNDCLGALEGAKLEFYSRMAQPYEKQKCLENGDVY